MTRRSYSNEGMNDALWTALMKAERWVSVNDLYGMLASDNNDSRQSRVRYYRILLNRWAEAGLIDINAVRRPILYAPNTNSPQSTPIIYTVGSKSVAFSADPAMPAEEFGRIVQESRISKSEWGRLLGWKGDPSTLYRFVRHLETGSIPITEKLRKRIRVINGNA